MPFDRCVIRNKTRGIALSSKAEVARTFRKRTKGLIGRSFREFTQGGALWIIPCDGIHTFGMHFPIDVAYLDSEGRIVRIYHRMAPLRIAALSFRTKSVLELPPGTLARTNTDVGDMLEFLPLPETSQAMNPGI